MTKTIKKLTPEQEARIPEWVDKWVRIGLSTEPADFDAAERGMVGVFKSISYERPKVILRMSSPYGAVLGSYIAITLLRSQVYSQVRSQVDSQVVSQVASQVYSQVGSQVRSQVDSQVDSQVVSQVASQVRSQVYSQVGSQVGSQVDSQVDSQVVSQVASQVRSQVDSQVVSQVESQVESQVDSQVGSQVGSQVDSQVGSQVGSQVESQVDSQVESQVESQVQEFFSCRRGGNLWASWYAYVSFFRDICGWENSSLPIFANDELIAINAGWTIWHHDVCAISDRPTILLRDNNGRLHAEHGPAMRWRDGYEMYLWHGVNVPADWIVKRAITPEQAISWANIEQRRAACEILGWSVILDKLNARIIHQDSPDIGTLLEVNLPDSGPERFLKVRCGTGREFVLPVPREIQTARQGNAWTYGVDPSTFNVEVRT